MLQELEEKAGVVLPQDLTTSEVNEYLQKKVKELGYECPPPLTTARLIDRVSSHLLLLHLNMFAVGWRNYRAGLHKSCFHN